MKKSIAGAVVVAAALTMAPQARADGAFLTCPDGYSGIATSVTSCAFAENVRASYIAQGGGTMIEAYSPVTGQYYDMQCASNFTANLADGRTVYAARCVGGMGAVVIIW